MKKSFRRECNCEGVSPCQSYNLQNKCAFTLAEVLITLGIIGIVAAMTLPTLVGNYQKAQTINQLKKAYSEINQAIRMAESEHGTIDSWDFKDFLTPTDRVNFFAENYLFEHIKIVQKCVPSSTKCWKDPVSLDGLPFEGGYANAGRPGRISFITSSGYSVYSWLHGTGLGGWFWVDVNGPKRGNSVVGKDVFPFVFSWGFRDSLSLSEKKGLLPVGLNYDPPYKRDDMMNGTTPTLPNYVCKKGTDRISAGGFCSAVIMMDGWQIKSDYPW